MMETSSPTAAKSSRAQSVMSFIGRKKRPATDSSVMHPADAPPEQPLSVHQSPFSPSSLAGTPVPSPSTLESPNPFSGVSDVPTPNESSSQDPRDKERKDASFAALIMRRRSMTTGNTPTSSPTSPSAPPLPTSTKYHTIRLVPQLPANSRTSTLHFDPVVRIVKVGRQLTIGRYLDPAIRGLDAVFDLDSTQQAAGGKHAEEKERKSDRVTFKSKVVSRTHAQVVVDENGQFMIRDTKSSSGTFLNNHRLSPPGQESTFQPLRDGDTLQLGVDFLGGREDVYRSVRIKVELGRGRDCQGGANAFNTSSLQMIRTLKSAAAEAERDVSPEEQKPSPAKKTHAGAGDCCICLFSLAVCQALFVAPCSHVFHYRCVRPLVERHYPGFSCPMCRTFADLEADVENMEDLPTLEQVLVEGEGALVGTSAAATPQERKERERRISMTAKLAGSHHVKPVAPTKPPTTHRATHPSPVPSVPAARGYQPETDAEIADRAERRAMMERMDQEELEAALEASRLAAEVEGNRVSEDVMPRLGTSVGVPPRTVLAINTVVHPPSPGPPARRNMMMHGRDELLTAVAPHSANPFHQFGGEEVTPTASPSPSPLITPPQTSGVRGR